MKQRKVTAVIALSWLVAISSISFAREKPAQVAFLVNGKLKVQSATGGAVRNATSRLKSEWHKQTTQYAKTSPNGKYRVNVLPDSSNWKPLQVVETATGRVVLDDAILSQPVRPAYPGFGGSFMDEASFSGWLPDSHHLALSCADTNTALNFQLRYVIDVRSKSVIPFNGWVSRDMKTAIVPNKDGIAFDVRGNVKPEWLSTDSSFSYYVVKLPSNINTYRFASASKKKLLFNGKPFNKMDLWSNAGWVQFSSDNKYALCRDDKDGIYGGQEHPGDCYIISLVTGKVRKLTGKKAFFIG